MRAGQGDRELHFAQGGRGTLPAPGVAHPALRCGGGGHALRRARSGRRLRAQDRGGRPGLRTADGGGLSAGGHRLRPQCAGRGDGHSGARRLCTRLHPGDRMDACQFAGGECQRRHQQPLVRLPRHRPRAPGDALGVSVPRPAGGTQLRDRQSGHDGPLRGDRTGAPCVGRGCGAGTRGGCRRASGRLCPAHPGRERVGRQDRCGRGVALVARGGADISCDGEGARRTDRRRCAGGRGRRNDAPRGDRPLLHARHGACGRALRAGKDVSAAGGEDGPCDEKGSGRPHASARGGRPGERRQGEGIARYGKGRCARHRKEYRIGGDGLQRLPHPRPGSDGRVRGDRGYGPRMGSRRDRPEPPRWAR